MHGLAPPSTTSMLLFNNIEEICMYYIYHQYTGVAKNLEMPQIYRFFDQMIGLFVFSVIVLVNINFSVRIPTNNTLVPGKN